MTSTSNGQLTVVGLGPGPDNWVTPAATDAVNRAQDLLGYIPYLNRIADKEGQTKHPSDNREEIARAKHALDLAASGRRVVVVSGGDPGVFAMATAVCEAIDKGPKNWRNIDIHIEPGVTAMLAAAARIGAPLGHDFAVISLSDILKPWRIIEKRLRLTSQADLAIALYNPASKTRKEQIQRAFDVLRQTRSLDTPVVLAKSVGRSNETIILTTLDKTDVSQIDMRTLVIVGSTGTRIVDRPGLCPLVYTERFVEET
ncbi:MAG: precorrin-3B C(17)-methyltransferase [Hyphomicrobiaceae bacterium]